MTKSPGALVSHQRFGLLSVDSGETLEDTDAQRMIRLWVRLKQLRMPLESCITGTSSGLSARIEEAMKRLECCHRKARLRCSATNGESMRLAGDGLKDLRCGKMVS
ncbi:hypothetical protein Dimus_019904 [Dionaea muscipula]